MNRSTYPWISWLAIFCANAAMATTPIGKWDAALETPGGALRFGLELSQHDSQWQAQLVNGHRH